MRALKERFELLAVLGQGGCGKVFRARDRESGLEVALKVLNGQAREAPRLFQRFVREARALGRIEHPNVTGVVASNFEGDSPWIALEYVAGEDLERRLQGGGALEVPEARRLARQLAAALSELHRHGIIHRDLKPANLMLREQDGSLAVTDLGLAALSDATVVTETGEMFGTPLYLPPEVVRGQAWTTQGDIYQAGCVLFEMLTGARLIAANAMAEALTAVSEGKHQRFPPGSQVPAELQAVVRRAVALDPGERFPSADAMAQALEAGAAGPGEVTQELAALESGVVSGGSSVPAPGRGPGGLPWTRLLPVLLLVGAGLGYFAGELQGAGPPREVHWQAVGDALVVSYLAPGRKDIRLNVGQELLAPDPGDLDERRRIVFRGLPATEEISARLVWDGGEGRPYRASADGPAVLGVAGAGEGGKVMLRAVRGSEAWWDDQPEVRFRLQRGKTPVPVPHPLPENLALSWVEQGVTFRRTWTREEVLGALAEDLLEYGAVPNWRPILTRRQDAREPGGTGFVAERAPWHRNLPWLAAMLETDLPERRREWLWERLVAWQVCAQAERLLGDDPPGLALDRGRAGSGFAGEPPGPTWRVEATYEPLDGANPRKELEPARVQMIAKAVQDNPAFGRKSLDYATRVEITWPETPSGPIPVHCLSIDVDRLKAHVYFLLRLRGGEETGDLVFFHPGVAHTNTEKHRGPVTRCYPAALSPPPGTPVLLTMEPLLTPILDFGGIRGVAVHVPKGE